MSHEKIPFGSSHTVKVEFETMQALTTATRVKQEIPEEKEEKNHT